MILNYLGKKRYRDESLLQLIFLLTLLRGNHDNGLNWDDSALPRILDLSIGSSLGHVRLPHNLFIQETHPKSLDRVLLNHQESVLSDLNALGSYSAPIGSSLDIHAYLLDGESSLSTPDTTEEGGYVSGPPSPESANLDLFIPHYPNILEDDLFSMEWERETNFLFEDIEALYKQDVDIGVPREIFDEESTEKPEKEQKLDIAIPIHATKDKDHGKEPDSSTEIEETTNDEGFGALNFTIDSETGELLFSNESSENAPISSHKDRSPMLSFGGPTSPNLNDTARGFELNLLEPWKFSDLSTSDTENEPPRSRQDSEADSGCGESPLSDNSSNSSVDFDDLGDTLEAMIQANRHHPHNPMAIQGRMAGLVQTGMMEQRWQELANLLTPSPFSPDPAHHAQSPPTPTMASHATSPIHSHSHPSIATGSALPPPPPALLHPHPIYPSHEQSPLSVGPSSSPEGMHQRGVVLHNSSIQPAMAEQPSHNITYSNSIGASSHLVSQSINLTNLQDIDDDHHYKMETSSAMQPDIMFYQTSGSAEINETSDGFISSLIDENPQMMDFPIPDYGNRGNGEYHGGSYRCDDQQRLPHGAQKKIHMYGKRYFPENTHPPPGTILPSNHNLTGVGVGVNPVRVGGPYHHPHYPPTPQPMPMEGAAALDPEMKYSCSTDFRSTPVSGAAAVENVVHNHTYHISPEGPSGITRSLPKDKKAKKSESQRHLTRDEKKAEAMRLPITCEDIINLPMDEFNERISKHDLTEAQLSLIRDIRRRGKNKVAAQNCRKRKLDQIIHLAQEVKHIQYQKTELQTQQEQLTLERERVRHKFSLLYKHIFQSLRDPDGNPYSPHEFSLQQSADGSILLVPKASPPAVPQPQHPMDHIKQRNSRNPTP